MKNIHIESTTGNNTRLYLSDIKINNKKSIQGVTMIIENDKGSNQTTISFTKQQATKLLCKLYEMISEIEKKE